MRLRGRITARCPEQQVPSRSAVSIVSDILNGPVHPGSEVTNSHAPRRGETTQDICTKPDLFLTRAVWSRPQYFVLDLRQNCSRSAKS
ncbi:hypothetical protein DPEC_G00137440 [Dallia pectoralis]|uniref:Uncharacterized protein n=1 Tax=Dallia pectoralis TaxID=75939 RepID=A0ACC2GM55_DALPE|nr:hypothetical protein DPEC_G00137440 [Dallia pectoralis]